MPLGRLGDPDQALSQVVPRGESPHRVIPSEEAHRIAELGEVPVPQSVEILGTSCPHLELVAELLGRDHTEEPLGGEQPHSNTNFLFR